MADAPSFNEWIVAEFRANEGKVGGPFDGRPLLLLHHVGAKSRIERVNPVTYQAVGESNAIFASNGGRNTNPAWYHNLLAHPTVTIEVGTSTVAVKAREAERTERTEIWKRQKELRPTLAEYETRTSRQIPVLILDPVK